MVTAHPHQLPMIPHAYQGEVITLRSKDGYFNATAMCKAAGKKWNDYARLGATQAFAAELAAATGIPATELIQSLAGGQPDLQGTWVHPQVAINLAQWLSPKFAVKVSEWIYAWMTGRQENAWQQFQDRISLVYDSVPDGYFCVFRECSGLYATMLANKVHPGTRMLLDGSIGLHWGKHWTAKSLESAFGARIKYKHHYPNYFPQSLSNPQEAWCYPDEALPQFRKWMREVYEREKLAPYLESQVSQGKISPIEANDTISALQFRGQGTRAIR